MTQNVYVQYNKYYMYQSIQELTESSWLWKIAIVGVFKQL